MSGPKSTSASAGYCWVWESRSSILSVNACAQQLGRCAAQILPTSRQNPREEASMRDMQHLAQVLDHGTAYSQMMTPDPCEQLFRRTKLVCSMDCYAIRCYYGTPCAAVCQPTGYGLTVQRVHRQLKHMVEPPPLVPVLAVLDSDLLIRRGRHETCSTFPRD